MKLVPQTTEQSPKDRHLGKLDNTRSALVSLQIAAIVG